MKEIEIIWINNKKEKNLLLYKCENPIDSIDQDLDDYGYRFEIPATEKKNV